MFKRFFNTLAALLAAASVSYAVTINGQFTQAENQVVRGGYFRMSTTGAITAFAGGGQGSAVLLDSAYNVVTTVATGNDSVKLPACNIGGPIGALNLGNTDGMMVWVTNAAAANSMNVFPQTGQSINALSANAAYAVAAGKTVAFICSPAGGIWYSNLGA